jgi:hypothetical protein
MLEEAARLTPIDFHRTNLDAYVSRADYAFVKPHGSVDWIVEGQAPFTRARFDESGGYSSRSEEEISELLIRSIDDVAITDTYRLDSDLPYRSDPSSQIFGLPAISIPVVGKSDFSCPQSHLEVLKSRLEESSKLLLIGWRASEAHFRNQILRGRVDSVSTLIVAANRDDAFHTAANLSTDGLTVGNVVCSPAEGFTKFLGGDDKDAGDGGTNDKHNDREGELERFLREDEP